MVYLHLLQTQTDLMGFSANYQRYASAGDKFIFLGEAVTLLLNQQVINSLKSLTNQFYVLEADCECRGIIKQIPAFVETISDDKMVQLTEESIQVISW